MTAVCLVEIMCLSPFLRMCCYWLRRVADSCRLGNEGRSIETLRDQPPAYKYLPQAAWNLGNQTQTGPHERRNHPANHHRISNEAPDGYPARNQSCPVEQEVQHHTGQAKSDPADRVGILARLDEHCA